MSTDLRTKQMLWLLVRFIVLFNSMPENSLYIHNPQENPSINLLTLKFIMDQIKKTFTLYAFVSNYCCEQSTSIVLCIHVTHCDKIHICCVDDVCQPLTDAVELNMKKPPAP